MAKVENLERVISAMRKLGAKHPDVSATVGFTQNYAIFVHENLEAHHPVGQAKYLEQPARELAGILGAIVSQAVKAGQTLANGLLLAGLRLQREAQKLCPVDTGALRASAFTRLNDGE